MKKYLKAYQSSTQKFQWKSLKKQKISTKGKISIGVLIVAMVSNFLYAQLEWIGMGKTIFTTAKVASVLAKPVEGVSNDDISELATSLTESSILISILKGFMEWIVNGQMAIVKIIASSPFGDGGMFTYVSSGLTIFAVIGCAIKIVQHYLATEKYDNVKAFTGFFSYFGVLLLFIFSNQIVGTIAGMNQNINTSSVTSIATKLETELNEVVEDDKKFLIAKIQQIRDKKDDGVLSKIEKAIKIKSEEVTFTMGATIKYIYVFIFSSILMAVLAIPTIIMTTMVKILLSLLIAGTKIVFLLAFIPGFENAWKTFMLNLLNVILWTPIFNTIITFIITIVASSFQSGAIMNGQIIWSSIVGIILAYQAVTLTTSGANIIVNGTGASMAGALGGMASMGATSIVAGGVKAGASIAMTAVGAGIGGSVAGGKLAGKLKK